MQHFSDIVSESQDGIRGEWKFDIMLESKNFSIPNGLDLEECRLPVILTGRKPTSWHCGEIGHLSAICLGKKAPLKTPNRIRNALLRRKEKKESPVV